MRDLGRQISDGKEQGCEMGECYSVRINSGLFGVPWRDTKRVLRVAGVDMVVVRPESQKDEVVESDGDGEVGVEDVQPESNSGGQGVDSVAGGKEEKMVQGERQDAEKIDTGKINKGLKRKSGEDGRDENGKKRGGTQTKLNFGKSQ